MIIAGTSTSEVIVETQIQGECSSYTKIETEVNGQKKVLETTEPGRYEVKLESSPTLTAAPSASPSPSTAPGTSSELLPGKSELKPVNFITLIPITSAPNWKLRSAKLVKPASRLNSSIKPKPKRPSPTVTV